MAELKRLTDDFKKKYRKFITDCEAEDLEGRWDSEENGDIAAYYENELISVILSLICSDGRIYNSEAEYFDKSFGFSYTAQELKDIYLNCSEEIDSYFDTKFRESYEVLKSISEKLSREYKGLFELICTIIIESDDRISDEEKSFVSKLKL